MFEYANESILSALEANVRGTMFRDLTHRRRVWREPSVEGASQKLGIFNFLSRVHCEEKVVVRADLLDRNNRVCRVKG